VDYAKEKLDLNYLRRFGAEIEINAFDGRNRPLNHGEGKYPEGTYYVANLIQKVLKKPVKIHKWAYDHNNDAWIIKPDSSCGIEICTPVQKGWFGVQEICKVIDELACNRKINADDRCSFHVHIDVSDLTEQQVATIITWWVKCEPVFMDSVPQSRKRNQYCQLLGQSEIFDRIEDDFYTSDNLIRKLGNCKYFTINTYHYYNNKRKTIEFRIMDSDACLDPFLAKNWIRLLIHFIEMSLRKGMPDSYFSGNPWSGYCWLDPKDVFEFLGLNGKYQLSQGLNQVKSWFIERLYLNCSHTFAEGVMGVDARSFSCKQIDDLYADLDEFADDFDDLFDKKFRI